MYVQCAVIEGTWLAFKYMSTKNGGKGGTVINVSSMGGQFSFMHACSWVPNPAPNTIILLFLTLSMLNLESACHWSKDTHYIICTWLGPSLMPGLQNTEIIQGSRTRLYAV